VFFRVPVFPVLSVCFRVPKIPMSNHETYMREALDLAARERVPPYPNPWVGCVIVKNGRTVARGWHRGPGTDHAEAGALLQAGSRARGATLYVTLEPCCHYGRTPPCTSAIIGAGVREVVYAIRDPNPAVAGRGARILRAAGIAVKSGVCATEAAVLNEVYLKFRATGLPFVSLKAGASLDGKTTTRLGESKWITGEEARRRGLEVRAQHQAVLAGINTILKDDPHLGPRLPGVPETWRLVLDSRLRIPLDSQVVRSGKCIVACTSRASARKKAALEERGVQVWSFPGARVPLRRFLQRLGENGIITVMVEGGSEVLGSLLDANLADRVYWFMSPMIIGSQAARSAVGGRGAGRLAQAWRLRNPRVESAGDGWLVTGGISEWALK
jgi:diaminohydroxyphosphoribosylaminopyrimidine deaminase / 5-amino-6-(5-phosphoribosylamino)uracil reductase